MAAQAYGFYFEVNRLCEHMGSLSKQISEAPANAIAVALHKKRNDIYISILTKSMGIINTIREVCLDKKMTEQAAHLPRVLHPSAAQGDEPSAGDAHQTGAEYHDGTGMAQYRIQLTAAQGWQGRAHRGVP